MDRLKMKWSSVKFLPKSTFVNDETISFPATVVSRSDSAKGLMGLTEKKDWTASYMNNPPSNSPTFSLPSLQLDTKTVGKRKYLRLFYTFWSHLLRKLNYMLYKTFQDLQIPWCSIAKMAITYTQPGQICAHCSCECDTISMPSCQNLSHGKQT